VLVKLPVETEAGRDAALVDVTPDSGARLRMGDGDEKLWPPPQPGQQKARTSKPHCMPDYAVVASGHCWLSLEQRPPQCPRDSFPHEGRCLAPLIAKERSPSTMDGGPHR
jgi:hypothetical protein